MYWKKGVIFLFLVGFFVNICYSVIVKAETISTRMEIRVGLTSMYSGKTSITVYNDRLGYGYCMGNTYVQEVVLISTNGFTFTPVNGYVVREATVYRSYREAKQVADTYAECGIKAYVGSTYQNRWRVYFGTASDTLEAERLVATIKEQEKKSSLEILEENNYRVLVEGSFGAIFIDVDEQYAYPQFRPLTTYKNGVKCIDMDSRVYRGRIEIGRYGKTTLTAVNILPIEEYLYSVVPSEMPSTWHEEALKAQAVCSRSYALIKAGYGGASNAKKGYKIVDTVSSQVYKGFLAESVKIRQVVKETKGQMVYYNNKVIPTYFFATSGGSTESSKDVWTVSQPYLQSVSDFYEGNAFRVSWQVTMTKNTVASLLSEQGIKIGSLLDLSPITYSATGRINSLQVTDSNRFLTLQGTTVRTVLNLYSTKFKIVKKGEIPDAVSVISANGVSDGRISEMYIISASGVEKASEKLEQYIVQSDSNLWNYPRLAPTESTELLFAGMGYGHGVGMSQYGAKGMAEAGFTYKEIIEYYFTGAVVR